MIKIVFAGTFAKSLVPSVCERLEVEASIVTCEEPFASELLHDADILVCMTFDQAMARAAPGLKLVQVPGAGLDRIDQTAMPTHTRLANVYGHETGIAEYVMGVLLAVTRSFGRLDQKLREGIWESQWSVGRPAPLPWAELAGKTIGLLGYGHIGREVARRARAFNMEVRAIRRQVNGGRPAELSFLGGPDRLEDLLQCADFLVITASLSAETLNLIGPEQLALMKPTSYLVNVARAEIVDEAALYRCLAARQIAGAALDVWYRYPTTSGETLPAAQPFHELDNILMTPHVSGWTGGMMETRSELIARNIGRTVRGELPLNLIGSAR